MTKLTLLFSANVHSLEQASVGLFSLGQSQNMSGKDPQIRDQNLGVPTPTRAAIWKVGCCLGKAGCVGRREEMESHRSPLCTSD